MKLNLKVLGCLLYIISQTDAINHYYMKYLFEDMVVLFYTNNNHLDLVELLFLLFGLHSHEPEGTNKDTKIKIDYKLLTAFSKDNANEPRDNVNDYMDKLNNTFPDSVLTSKSLLILFKSIKKLVILKSINAIYYINSYFRLLLRILSSETTWTCAIDYSLIIFILKQQPLFHYAPASFINIVRHFIIVSHNKNMSKVFKNIDSVHRHWLMLIRIKLLYNTQIIEDYSNLIVAGQRCKIVKPKFIAHVSTQLFDFKHNIYMKQLTKTNSSVDHFSSDMRMFQALIKLMGPSHDWVKIDQYIEIYIKLNENKTNVDDILITIFRNLAKKTKNKAIEFIKYTKTKRKIPPTLLSEYFNLFDKE